MKSLEEEAEEYSNKGIEWHPEYPNGLYYAFQAGANSKYVQAEKIKAQIDCWEKALKIIILENEDRIISLVYNLKKQLKDLEQ